MQWITGLYQSFLGVVRHFDGVASLMLRLILAPVLMAAGWEKISGVNWFADALDTFPFPFNVLPPALSWFLASWTELIGGALLLVGLGVRVIAIPLMVTMFVAAYSVHLPNGWPAIAPSSPDVVCTDSAQPVGAIERYVKCHNVNERTVEASVRLARAKSILREHGNYSYLNGSGPIVKLNNGIEFAAMYFAMLAALLIIGGGRYLSLDYWIGLFRRFGPPNG